MSHRFVSENLGARFLPLRTLRPTHPWVTLENTAVWPSRLYTRTRENKHPFDHAIDSSSENPLGK